MHDRFGIVRVLAKRLPLRDFITAASLAIAPFSAFLYSNREYMGMGDIWLYPVVLVGVIVTFGAPAFFLVGRTWGSRVCLILGWGVFALFLYRDIGKVVDRYLAFTGVSSELGWLVVLGVGAFVIFKLADRPRVLLAGLLFSVSLALLPLMQYGFVKMFSETESADRSAVTSSEAWSFKPDIYYLVLDGLARADVLDEVYGVDVAAFTEILQRDGFVVADRALGAHPLTWLSVPAVLEQEYQAHPGRRGRPATHSRSNGIMSGNNRTHEELTEQGYRFVTATEDEAPFCDLNLSPIRERTTCLVQGNSMDAAIRVRLVEMTPLLGLANRGIFPGLLSRWLTAEDLRPTRDSEAVQAFLVDDLLDVVQSVKTNHEGIPIFVLAHLMYPHPPFTLDSECEPSSHPGFRPSFDSWDDLVGLKMGVACTQKQILELIERVESDAVIVLQSDHGPGLGLLRTGTEVDVEEVPIEDLWVRASVFSAVRLPAKCRDWVSDTYAGVNTFRVILGCLSGKARTLEPVSSFWTWYGDDRTVVDLTDRLRLYESSANSD